MNIRAAAQEKMLFFSKFLKMPAQIGSVTPSSRFLAELMVQSIPWHEVKRVAELGAGTGAITKAIRTAMPHDTKVLLFEKDECLRSALSERFTGFSCYPDACAMEYALAQEHIESLDCIVSGLPFANFPQQVRDRLMHQITESLRPDGLFIAFQYSLQMRLQLLGHFDIVKIKFTPWNVPPAFVYVCRKKGAWHDAQ